MTCWQHHGFVPWAGHASFVVNTQPSASLNPLKNAYSPTTIQPPPKNKPNKHISRFPPQHFPSLLLGTPNFCTSPDQRTNVRTTQLPHPLPSSSTLKGIDLQRLESSHIGASHQRGERTHPAGHGNGQNVGEFVGGWLGCCVGSDVK